MTDSVLPGGRRANIVFIQSDSQDGRAMGWAGHPAMARATPNLDALAAAGVAFETACCNNPICCPSRASMWSGRYTHHCEAWNNYKGLEPETPTFRTSLDAAGYRTQTFGKTDYLSGAHTIRARVTAWLRSACIPRPAYRMNPPLILERDEPRVHEMDWDDADRSAAWLADAAGEPDRPFFLYLGIRAPHPGFTSSRMYLDRIDAAGVTIPPADRQDHPCMAHQRVCKNWPHGFAEEMVRKVRHIYFAMIAEVDAMVGRVLAAIDELGLAGSTYVIFTSDHGELAMEHRQEGKMNLYEPAVRVPLIVRGPGVPAGRRVAAAVSLVDIYPTLMDLAGLAGPAGLDGESLLPALTGREGPRRDWVLSEYHDTTLSTGCFMLRRGDWKYLAYVGCEPQLFHLADDPHEIVNLAADRPGVVAGMDARLREIVDYEAVDAKVKAYDRASFRQWRTEQKSAGTYEQTMARIYSGWDRFAEGDLQPWTDRDEAQVRRWLDAGA